MSPVWEAVLSNAPPPHHVLNRRSIPKLQISDVFSKGQEGSDFSEMLLLNITSPTILILTHNTSQFCMLPCLSLVCFLLPLHILKYLCSDHKTALCQIPISRNPRKAINNIAIWQFQVIVLGCLQTQAARTCSLGYMLSKLFWQL